MRLGTKNERWLGHRAELGSRGFRTKRVASNVNDAAREEGGGTGVVPTAMVGN